MEKNNIYLQIKNLKKRIKLVKYMQILGVLSFIFCSGSMLLLYIKQQKLGVSFFGASMILLTFSLIYSLWEVLISTNAIKVELEYMENKNIG